MAKEITISIDESIYDKTKRKFDEFGVDYEKGIIYLLEEFINDKPIITEEKRRKSAITIINKSAMNKQFAKSLFTENGCEFYPTYTYASITANQNFYWANPRDELVYLNWSIVLNDSYNKNLYLLNIPKNSIAYHQFANRKDKGKENLIDMRIRANDYYYTDIASGIPLKKFLVAKVDYSDLENISFKKYNQGE